MHLSALESRVQRTETGPIVFLLLGIGLVVYLILKLVLLCKNIGKAKPEHIVLNDGGLLPKSCYNSVLQELVDGEEIKYGSSNEIGKIDIILNAIAFGNGLLTIIFSASAINGKNGYEIILLALVIIGYTSILFSWLVTSTWFTYDVVAITNKRAISMQVIPTGRLRSARQKVIATSPLQNLELSSFTIRNKSEALSFGALEYSDRSSQAKYILKSVVNPEDVKSLVERLQSSNI